MSEPTRHWTLLSGRPAHATPSVLAGDELAEPFEVVRVREDRYTHEEEVAAINAAHRVMLDRLPDDFDACKAMVLAALAAVFGDPK